MKAAIKQSPVEGSAEKLAGSCDAKKAGVHVPGAAATPVDAGMLWGAMTRWLLSSSTTLASFVKSFIGNEPWECRGTAPKLWPMAAPYPHLFKSKLATEGRDWVRRQQAVNLIVLTLSWLQLGKPKSCPTSLSCSTELSAVQWKAVSRIEEHVKDVLKVGVVGPAEMGRGAAKVESLEGILSVLEQKAQEVVGDGYVRRRSAVASKGMGSTAAAGHVIGQMAGAAPTVAKAIEPERLSLPVAPPSFDPTELLPSEHRQVFLDPVATAAPVDPFVDQVPKVRVHASRKQVRELLRRLDGSGRVVLAKPHQVRESLLCGAFALVKDAEQDRLILDARPPNSKETTLDAWCKTLASCHTLALQELGQDQIMYFSGTDLKDYYHAFKVPRVRAFRNALACALTPDEAQVLSCFKPEHWECPRLYPCLSALAMGDNQAVELGQLSHIQLGFLSNAFAPHEILAVHGRAPRGEIAAGIVIDDVILSEKAEADMAAESLESVKRLNLLCEEYLQQGLLAHPRKTFRGETEAEFWGCCADGVSGRVRANPKRVVPLMELTIKTARLKVASVSLLEVLAGGWISVLQTRRRMLCLVQHLYEAQRGRSQQDVVALSAELIEELFVLVILAPMAAADMRAPSIPEIFMSDASEWGSASVRSCLPLVLAQEFQRHALSRGAWSRLLTPWKAWLKMHEDLFPDQELPDGVPLVSHPLWLLLAQCLAYDVNHVKRERSRRHINLIELQSVLEVEKKLAMRRGCCRYLLGADSQVALAALVKGRSASPKINALLQSSLPWILGSGIFGNYGYVPSLANPSDDPTRGEALRGAVCELPDWWAEAAEGDFRAFDAWISALGYDPLKLAELPFAENGSVDSGRVVEDLLAKLQAVQKPERMVRFREMSAVALKPSTDVVSPLSNPVAESVHCTAQDAATDSIVAVDSPSNCTEVSAVSPQLKTKERSRGHKRPEEPNKSQKKRPKNENRKEKRPNHHCVASKQSPTATVSRSNHTGPSGPPLAGVAFEALPWCAKPKLLGAEAKSLLAGFQHHQFILPNGKRAKKGFVPDRQGVVDLYSGAAGVAKQIAKTYGVWVLTVDYNGGPDQDLLQEGLQLKIRRLLELDAVLGLGMAPECASFSRAVCPPVRSRSEPWGFSELSENMTEKVKKGNLHATFCAGLVELCEKLLIPYWLENPDSSFLWLLPAFLQKGIGWPENSYRVDFCRFSTPWRKRTRIATNTALAGCAELCRRDHDHLVLRGRSALHRMAWTRVAQVYPSGFCRKLCRAMGAAMKLKPLGKQAKLHLTACARAEHARIGEASNPGPNRVNRVERDVNVLLGIPLVNPGTQKLQHRVWSDFQAWLTSQLSPETVQQVFVCPALAVEMLRNYGVELFRTGHAIYELRHLLALVQRMYPAVRPVLAPAWALVTQWEELNPVQHRQPLPELMFRAMFALAWMWGWKRFSALLLMGFEGIARAGELFRARRADLVLPSDLGSADVTAAFLRIRKPKTMRRGKGRIQHIKVADPAAVKYLEAVFGPLEEFLPLFPLSASAFRNRWQKLLIALGVPRDLQPTPASIRGGGAIAAYHRGEDIPSIMWRMRLLSMSTLESYLQELAAETFMTRLSVNAKSKIRSAAMFFPLALGRSV